MSYSIYHFTCRDEEGKQKVLLVKKDIPSLEEATEEKQKVIDNIIKEEIGILRKKLESEYRVQKNN